MSDHSGGSQHPSLQLFELLIAHPYEALPEMELRNLVQLSASVRALVLEPQIQNVPFWDAYVALTYHALSLYRLPITEKLDRVLEDKICECAKMLMDYCVNRLGMTVENTFLTRAQNVKLLADICNLDSSYGKNDIVAIHKQLHQASAELEVGTLLKIDLDEERRESKKNVHNVPSVPVVDVRNLISPIIHKAQLVEGSNQSYSTRSDMSRFSERYGKVLHSHLKENRFGDKLIGIFKDLHSFILFMDTDSSNANLFKAVITRLNDAKLFLGKIEILSSEVEVALQLSKIPLANCCSPEKLQVFCAFGVSCIANSCKILTSLNTIESQLALEDVDGSLQRCLNEVHLPAMKKMENLTTIYEQVEKNISSSQPEFAKNIGALASRYLLCGVEGILLSASDTGNTSPFGSAAIALIRHLMVFLLKLIEDVEDSDVSTIERFSFMPTTQLSPSQDSTPWIRLLCIMKQHDVFNCLFRALSICHGQVFTRLAASGSAPSVELPTSGAALKSLKSKHRERDPDSSSPRASSRPRLSLSQDDLILGCLWEELNADPLISEMTHSAGTFSESTLTESLLDTCSKFLSFLENFFMPDRRFTETLVREFLTSKHLCYMLPMMTGQSTEYVKVGEHDLLRSCISKYEANIDLFFHNLVTTGFVSDEIFNSVLKAIGLDVSPSKKNDPWPLYLPKTLLSFFGRLLLRWQFDQPESTHESPRHVTVSSAATLTIWSRVCVALQQRTVRDNDSTAPQFWKEHVSFEDMNPEHLYLLLLCFHGLPLMQKKAVLCQLAATFVSMTCKTKLWNERNLLIVSRALVTIGYLVHYLYEPSETLLLQVENLIFPAAARDRTKLGLVSPVYEFAQKVCDRLPKTHERFPSFYYVVAPDLCHTDPLTLDGLACSFLLAPNKLPEYADFYEALVNLFNQLNSTLTGKNDDLRIICAFNYTSLLTWRLLRILPPTLSQWEHFRKDSQEFPLDSVQNITTVLWTMRIGMKTFRTWVKDTFVKLGATPLNADIMLSNCAEVTGFSKDIVRLRNFMDAFLGKRKQIKPKLEENPKTCEPIIAIDASPLEENAGKWIIANSVRSSWFSDSFLVSDEEIPALPLSLSLVCLICKVQQGFDDVLSDPKSDGSRLSSVASLLLPSTLNCIIRYTQFMMSNILNKVSERLKGGPNIFEIYRRLAVVSGQSNDSLLAKANHLADSIPPLLNDVLVEWQMKEAANLPVFHSWKKEYQHSEAVTFDSFVNNVVTSQMVGGASMKMGNPSGVNSSVKYTLHTLLGFLNELQLALPAGIDQGMKDQFREALLPFVMGCFASGDAEIATSILERVLGESVSQVFYMESLMSAVCDILKLVRSDDISADLDPTALANRCIETLNSLMDSPPGRKAMGQLCREKSFDVAEIMLSITRSQFSTAYDILVLNFVNRLLEEIIKDTKDEDLSFLSQSFSRVEQRSPDVLRIWMDKVLRNSSWKDAGDRKCIVFLDNWVIFIQTGDRVIGSILSDIFLRSLTAIASPSMGTTGSDYPSFSDLMPIMEALASSCDHGHEVLLTASVGWIKVCVQYLSEKDVYEKFSMGVTGGSLDQVLASVNSLVSYVEKVLSVMRIEAKCTASPDSDDIDIEYDGVENDEDDSGSLQGDGSDEDYDESRLCTYTITAKEFMSQHWYHCHTCGLTNGQGMCSVCAKVCHKDHDVTYSKYGSFFCDCGAKEDGSCQSLRKRGIISGADSSNMALNSSRVASAFSSTSLGTESRKFKDTSSHKGGKDTYDVSRPLKEQLDSQRVFLIQILSLLNVPQILMSLTDLLSSGAKGVMETICSIAGRSHKIAQRLKTLQTVTLAPGGKAVIEPSERLLQPLLATQEGTFDSIKSNAGEIVEPASRSTSHSSAARRCVMAVFNHGSAKYLAMAVEKTKLTIFQLSHLLKQVCDRQQANSNASISPKLMLPTIGNVSCSFAISSIIVNPLRDGLIAIMGVKECAVVLLSPENGIHELINVSAGPSESSTSTWANHVIIKALWMPDSQTELLVATLDSIKIFDLSKSTEKPVYDLLIANGKIRDVTVAFLGFRAHVLAMSSTGQVFLQELNPVAKADMGPFFVTAVLNLAHPDIPRVVSRDDDDHGNAGLAIYYSHAFQLVFLSYEQGKLYVAPLPDTLTDSSVIPATQLIFGKSRGDLTQGKSIWYLSESGGFPGQIFAWLQGISVPIVISLDAEGLNFQVVKPSTSKTKVLDMVVTRNCTPDGIQAILASVNDDGTLKFFSILSEQMSSWSPFSAAVCAKATMHQKIKGNVREPSKNKEMSGSLSFPIDFFEDCSILANVEFGGDLIDVYPKSKLKSRLEQNAQYIVSERASGFTITITNLDSNYIVCGFRVGVGSQGVEKIPSFVRVMDRTKTFVTQRPRHFDFPLTEEESIMCDGKLSLFFAACENSSITYLDSIVIYGKAKATFGWADDGDQTPTNPEVIIPAAPNSKSCAVVALIDSVCGKTLRALELAIGVWPLENAATRNRVMDKCIDFISSCRPLTNACHNAETLLFALHDFRNNPFHLTKDRAIVGQTMRILEELFDRTKNTTEHRNIMESCQFFQVVNSLRPIAVKRPTSFYQQITENVDETKLISRSEMKDVQSDTQSPLWKAAAFLDAIASTLYVTVLLLQPKTSIASVVELQEFVPLEKTIHCVVDITHAVMVADPETIPLVVKIYANLIGSKDLLVALAAKTAILRTLKLKASPHLTQVFQKPTKNTEKPVKNTSEEPSSANILSDVRETNDSDENEVEDSFVRNQQGPGAAPDLNVEDMLGDLQMVWQMVEPHLDGGQLEEFIENSNNLQQMLDIPPDADDEAMIDLAMALNMQPDDAVHENASSVGVASVQPQIGEESSDSNTDAEGASDDEVSNAPTETSALRPLSPNELQGSSQGSDEGSGKSSLAGDAGISQNPENSKPSVVVGAASIQNKPSGMSENILRQVRRAVVEHFEKSLPSLADGLSAIPTMQLLFNLCTDLEPDKFEEDRVLVERVIHGIISCLRIDRDDKRSVANRTAENEIVVLSLRFLSVIISKSASRYKRYGSHQLIPPSFTNYCVGILSGSKVIDFCHSLLKTLLEKSKLEESNVKKRDIVAERKLLKPKILSASTDLSPFFQKPFVKSCGHDLFYEYETLLTETALRLPYQMKKVGDSERILPSPSFEPTWCFTLSEYMFFGPNQVDRRTPRKLLMALCGSKEKYRQVRDLHAFEHHIKEVKKVCGYRSGIGVQEKLLGDLDYDQLTLVVEHLKGCLETALVRTVNWQRYCQKERMSLAFLIRLAITLDEPLASTILQLLLALFGLKEKTSLTVAIDEGPIVKSVITLLNQNTESTLLRRFVRSFLLQSSSTSIRGLAHHFLLAYYRNSDAKFQDALIRVMWNLFEELPIYGHKATEFVDLLGFLTVKNPFLSENDWRTIILSVIDMLKAQNHVINDHPYARIYQQLCQITGLEGYFLESDPCLVCNCPDAPTQIVKLSSIKADAKYTSSSQLYKLSGAFFIDRITLKITELKRAKMVKTLTVYYSSVAVDNIVELKNNMAAWKKAKSVAIASGQTDVKIEFMLPVLATSLMIEYSEYYDNPQMTQETVQCPRCSTMVPSSPGICGNCGENVFQCLKCRSINYEDREPFLCHSCGFCKYGKFDFNVHCRPSSTGNVDPVTNEEQRRRTILLVDQLLAKCDSQYRTLQSHRSAIELMFVALQNSDKDSSPPTKLSETSVSPATFVVPSAALNQTSLNNTANVNPAIQAIAYRYSVECKSIVQAMVANIQKITSCRKLLKAYDRRQSRTSMELQSSKAIPEKTRTPCYGCATASSQFTIRLLRVIAKVKSHHYFNAYPGLINELIENHFHRGNPDQRMEVKRLINSLMQRSQGSAVEFITLLQERISSIQKFCSLNPSIAVSVGSEITLLEMDADHGEDDRHWEIRLRCVVRLFLNAVQSATPGVLECIALPCLKIILNALKADSKCQNAEACSSLQLPSQDSLVRVVRWLKGDARNSFQAWTNRCPKKILQGQNAREIRMIYLMQKYGIRWRDRVRHASERNKLHFGDNSWLKRLVFYPGSQQLRAVTVEIVEHLMSSSSRRFYVDQFIGKMLEEVGRAGEYAAEYVNLVRQETETDSPFIFVACRGILTRVTDLITKEIDKLAHLEAVASSSSLGQGCALRYFTTILGNLLNRDDIKARNRNALIGPIFNGYLALRKLVTQRTKQVNDAEEKLLEIMEGMTSGTDAEIKSFMRICLDALSRCVSGDYRTPQFICERLCTIIFPQGKEKTEFSLVIEKDPQQEDFLQGRMQGNPYSLAAVTPRTTSGNGEREVIMRDIKNKVCRDCELIALLDDDTAMELLVAGKIVSLDLPVKGVYKRIWLRDNPEGSSMRVMYRLRGLMGDATEEFIENLDSRNQDNSNPEEVYKLASILADGNGFPIIIALLTELSAASVPDQAGPLLEVILKLFTYAINLKVNRQALIIHAGDWSAFSTFVSLLKNTIKSRPTLAHQVVSIMETSFKEALDNLSVDSYSEFVGHCGSITDITELLLILNTLESDVKSVEELLHVLPFLCFCDDQKMRIVVQHFENLLDFAIFESDSGTTGFGKLEWLCRMIEQLGLDDVSATFKDLWLRNGMTKKVVDYFLSHSATITTASPESQEFKKCVGKTTMKYVLRLLTGLARGHEATQVLLSRDCVPSIHRLEHVSTPLSVLAENLMEVMKENGAVKKRIEQIRDHTKAEKKRLAMAMRARQLGAMGMTINEKGEIVVTKPAVKGLEDLADDKGLHCCICREGYKFKPEKVLGIYTFTKRQPVEEIESKSPKTFGFNSVTHFTCIHVDCHASAIKSTRDEWDKAALHNANTKCNGILPMWGPQVPESSYVQALARYNQLVQDFTGVREMSYTLTVHDLKLSLIIFAEERSFSEVSRGGGRDSNIRLIPYVIHQALYVMNSQRNVAKERTTVQAFLKSPRSAWRSQCHLSESPLYFATLYLLLYERKQWSLDRLPILQRLLVYSHERRNISSSEPQEYSVYKSSFMFFGLIELLYSRMFGNVTAEVDWSEALATFIRRSDLVLMDSCESILQIYEEELLPATSAAEIFDVLALRDLIHDPHAFIQSAFTAPSETAS